MQGLLWRTGNTLWKSLCGYGALQKKQTSLWFKILKYHLAHYIKDNIKYTYSSTEYWRMSDYCSYITNMLLKLLNMVGEEQEVE